jgi:predicted dehydrogenase
MALNPVIEMLGRRLRLAVIGGGVGSFIGAMHRQAARLDDRYEIVTGIFSANAEKSRADSLALGLPDGRIYSGVAEMFDREKPRADSIDAVAIMTPNDSHYEYSVSALEHGFDVICDKPMTNTLEEAESLHKKVLETGLVFCLTHNYTGYPMVRQAKAMAQDGQLGVVRLIQVEYVQGGKADEDMAFSPDNWKFDPVRGGPSRVMGDIGTHAHNLARFITGLEVAEVAAEIGTIVPNRKIHDFAGALLRFDNGARGSFWVTQAAAGVENCLRIRVSGTKGSVEWMQEIPQALTFKPLKGPSQNRTPNGPETLPLAAHSSRIVAGHPEGFPDGFANIYSDAAEAIAARRAGKQPDPLAIFFPNSFDGLQGVKFVDSVIKSSEANGAWTKC